MANCIAIIECAPAAAGPLHEWVSEAHFAATQFESTASFSEQYREGFFDLLTLATTTVDEQVMALLRHVREDLGSLVPLIVVAEQLSDRQTATMLDAGADDVLSGASGALVTLARMRALLRRARQHEGVKHHGDYCIDRLRRQISFNDRPVSLTEKEFQLADLLLSNADRLLSRDFLLQTIWGGDMQAGSRTVDTHASRVRQKLKFTRHNEFWLRPVYGKGYKLLRRDHARRTSPNPRPNPCDTSDSARAGASSPMS